MLHFVRMSKSVERICGILRRCCIVHHNERIVLERQEGFPMKMNGQSRAFAKQVQVDLLALSDTDLVHTIHQWVDGRNPSGLYLDVPEDTRFALGYTHVL